MRDGRIVASCLLACAVLSCGAEGRYAVSRSAEGAFVAVDPRGREFRVHSIDQACVPWWLGEEEFKRRCGSVEKWAEDAFGRMKDMGFNLLGCGCDESLWHRGIPHTIDLRLALNWKINRSPERMMGGTLYFPNVFHPDFPAACERVAAEKCTPGDRDLFGYFLDNELNWPAGKRDTGMFDTCARAPSSSYERRALDAFLASRGLDSPDSATREVKLDFLRLVADRYFSVFTQAVRRHDPNHLVLGCRFAGLKGAHDVVWEVAGKYCDVVTFNCYPYADLDREAVYADFTHTRLLADEIRRKASFAKRPLLVTEMSFPSVDSGLPCLYGCGMRMRTQADRAKATRLMIETLLAEPCMIGYTYFMWWDEPIEGYQDSFPEDTNYGLNTIDMKPYKEMAAMLREVQTSQKRHSALVPKEGREKFFVPLEEFLEKAGLSLSGGVSPGVFPDVSPDDALSTKVGSPCIVDSIRYGGEDYGCLKASLTVRSFEEFWPRRGEVLAARKNPGSCDIDFSFDSPGGDAKGVMTFNVVSWPRERAFLVRVKSVRNTGAVPFFPTQVNLGIVAPFFAIDLDEAKEQLVGDAQRGAWHSCDGRWIGSVSASRTFANVMYRTSQSSFVTTGRVDHAGTVVLSPGGFEGSKLQPGEVAEYDDAWALYLYGSDGRGGWLERTDALPVFPRGTLRERLAARRKTVHEIDGRKVLRGSIDIEHRLLRPLDGDPAKARLDAAVAASVRRVDLADLGIKLDPPSYDRELECYSILSDGDHWKRNPPMMFADGRRLPLSRWPNGGWAEIAGFVNSGKYADKKLLKVPDSTYSEDMSRLPVFRYSGDRPERWTKAPLVLLRGFWCYDWTESFVTVKSIDPVKKSIELAQHTRFGIRPGNPSPRRWRAVNLLEELDEPGEYAVDWENSRIYILPPADFSPSTRLSVSKGAEPIFVAENLEDVEFTGLVFEEAAGKAVVMKNCRNVVFRNCTFRNLRREAVVIGDDCRDCSIVGCTIEDIGTVAVMIAGGDRRALVGGRNSIEGSTLRAWGGEVTTAAAGVYLEGVGNAIRGCVFADSPTLAIWNKGNQMLVERNVFTNLSSAVDDGGAYYQGRNPSARGNEMRGNLWVDVGGAMGQGTCAVYFDDGDCGSLVVDDVFLRCGFPGRANFGTVMSHGGYGHYVRGCRFVDCVRPFGSAPWDNERWREFVYSGRTQDSMTNEVKATKRPYVLAYPELYRWYDEAALDGSMRTNVAIDCTIEGSPTVRTTVVPGERKPGILCGNWVTNNVQVTRPVAWDDAVRAAERRMIARRAAY